MQNIRTDRNSSCKSVWGLASCVMLRGEMAQRGHQLNSEKFSCSICLDLLKHPNKCCLRCCPDAVM
uniref:Uncharacterized protein n=1 Tax=Stegastes partitus TaxID=144197 RepID=A0A3B4ZCD2_9TELE